MDIKARGKPAVIHFCSTSLQRHSTIPCMYRTQPACVKVSLYETSERSTKPEGFLTPQETPWEMNTLRVNSSGVNHLFPSDCC